jgi:hypothetical protein
MTGNNELILNEATMKEAVQFWLNSQMVNPPKVTNVKAAKGDSYSPAFSISLDSDEHKGGFAIVDDAE